MKLHLDTDIGGDLDDLCALAMLLRWSDLTITGITTTAEENGRRAGYVDYVLRLEGRTDIPVAAGVDVDTDGFRYRELGYPPDAANWPGPVPPRPGLIIDALTLLKDSIEQGAVIAAIGPFTNLMLLDQQHPGILHDANLVLMGGCVYNVPSGYPQWSKTDDWNIQLHTEAARYVLEHASPLLVPLTVSTQTALRRTHLPRLAQAGMLGALIVRQTELFARTEGFEQKYGATNAALPADIINFQHDGLACAIALGWDVGVEIESVPLRLEMRDSYLYEIPDPAGKPTRLVTRVDGRAFDAHWLNILSGSAGTSM
jgi:purine nucleosidase